MILTADGEQKKELPFSLLLLSSLSLLGCLPAPFNQSFGLCVAGTADGPFAAGLCGTWTFSTCDVSAQQSFVLNLGILVSRLLFL